MNRILALVTIAAALTTASTAQEKEPPARQEKSQKAALDAAAEKAPVVALGKKVTGKIVLADIDGEEHELFDLEDKITVVNFWSITCPIMQGWEDRMSAIHEQYSKKGVQFVTINSNVANGEIAEGDVEEGEKPYAKIRDYLKKNELPYTVLVDKGSKVADVFKAKTTPDIFVFDKEGVLVYRGLIDDDARGSKGEKAKQYLRTTLDAVLAGEKVEASETKPQGCNIKRPRKASDRGGR